MLWKCPDEDEKPRRNLEVGPQAPNTTNELALRSLLFLYVEFRIVVDDPVLSTVTYNVYNLRS